MMCRYGCWGAQQAIPHLSKMHVWEVHGYGSDAKVHVPRGKHSSNDTKGTTAYLYIPFVRWNCNNRCLLHIQCFMTDSVAKHGCGSGSKCHYMDVRWQDAADISKAPISWFLVSHQVLSLHTMRVGGYYHYAIKITKV